MQQNLRLRSNSYQAIRSTLVKHDFCEVETPTLFKSTPEGAREFIVPTRKPGLWYALTQSPQQYKQLLIASGIDRYFQIARCYRDEDQRADRQPEFTQVDLEMAWATPKKLQMIVEDVVGSVITAISPSDHIASIPILTYEQAMKCFGSDKPDLRFDISIADYTNTLSTPDNSLTLDGLHIPKMYCSKIPSGQLKKLCFEAQQNGITMFEVKKKCSFPSIISRLPSNVVEGDLMALHLRSKKLYGGSTVMGRWRLHLIRALQIPISPGPRLRWTWITGFPLFSPAESDSPMHVMGKSRWVATHHPFTAPDEETKGLLKVSPENVRGQHIDLVVNGVEVGGGSVRLHDAEDQVQVWNALNFSAIQRAQFSHLETALRMGCPPHGGFALGLDRLLAVILDAPSVREVIAFPKRAGEDPMVGAPSVVDEKTLNLYNVKVSTRE
jgi:aspartyl-tRNA synthetase